MNFWNSSKEPPFRSVPYGADREASQLDRIEDKLDTLIQALAQDDEDAEQEQGIDLDGNATPAERDQNDEL